MKKISLLFAGLFIALLIKAQNHTINFVASGVSFIVDSVKVENLMQNSRLTLDGNDQLHLVGTIGISQELQNSGSNLNISPNPFSDKCFVSFYNNENSNICIELISISGKKIIHISQFLPEGYYTFLMKGIEKGFYLLRISISGNSYCSKIISNNYAAVKTPEISKINETWYNSGIYFKNSSSAVEMQYNTGDRLKFTGYAQGKYARVFMLVPDTSQIINFNFINCMDADSSFYAVVQIGTQEWMAENLKTTHFRDGSDIPNITDAGQWSGLTTGAYCYYENNIANATNYGALYNWYAVNTSNLCPTGWHVPSDDEWTTLTDYVGDASNAGTKLKATSGWFNNGNGTDNFGFSGVPGGYRDYDGAFVSIGKVGYWWSATEYDATSTWAWGLSCYFSDVNRSYNSKVNGFSVRCLRDY